MIAYRSALSGALDLVTGLQKVASPETAANRMYETLRTLGLVGLGLRTYARPGMDVTSQSLWDQGGFLVSIEPKGWSGSLANRYICLENNPLLEAVRERRLAFRFSEYAPYADPGFGAYWEAFGEAGVKDGIGLITAGPGSRMASLSLLFSHDGLRQEDVVAIQMAGMVLLELVKKQPAGPDLSPREHDCMALVAAGLSDGEISDKLKVSATTVRFHIDNARRKLGSLTRAQAVARLAAFGRL
jgi:DNA-binding CsgD family transcriptional regulator